MVIANIKLTGVQLVKIPVQSVKTLPINSALITFPRLTNTTPIEISPPMAGASIKKSVLNPKILPAATPTSPIPAAIETSVTIKVRLFQLSMFIT